MILAFRFSILLELSICAAVTFCSCRKDSFNGPGSVQIPKANQPGSDTMLNDTSFYVDVTIDGVRTFYISGRNGCDMYYGGGGLMDFSGITSDSNTYPALGSYYNTSFLEFDKFDYPAHAGPPTDYDTAGYNAWAVSNYAPGTYYFYSQPAQLSLFNGITLVWTNALGVQWKTNSGDESTASFQIVKEEPLYAHPGGYVKAINVSALFSCILYEPSGTPHLLTNGKFRLGIWL